MNRFFTLLLAASCLTAVGQVPDYVPTEGLVAWYPFNGNADDESGNDNDGTVNGASLSSDRFNNSSSAFDFDGFNDFIDCGNAPSIQISGALTYSAWINLDTYTNFSGIIGRGEGTGGSKAISMLMITTSGSKKLYFEISEGDPREGVSSPQEAIQPGTWTHVVGVWYGADADSMAVFIDGALSASAPSVTTEITGGTDASDNLLKIGNRDRYSSGYSYGWFDGRIDDLGVWNRALSNDEILGLFLSEPPNPGCTDSAACNYDENASFDDGSCIPSGCMNPEACNYVSEAGCDDGSCDYTCCPGPGCCGEGTAWNWQTSECDIVNPADINLDGCVQLNDLLDLLSAYGDCGSEETPWQCGDPLEYQGYEYMTALVGEQCWFAENLRAGSYRNGSVISNDNSFFEGMTSAWNEINQLSPLIEGEEGHFYSLGVIQSGLEVCPTGWSTPSLNEWYELALETEVATGGYLLKDSVSWNGVDTYGFSAKPVGRVRYNEYQLDWDWQYECQSFLGYQDWYQGLQIALNIAYECDDDNDSEFCLAFYEEINGILDSVQESGIVDVDPLLLPVLSSNDLESVLFEGMSLGQPCGSYEEAIDLFGGFDFSYEPTGIGDLAAWWMSDATYSGNGTESYGGLSGFVFLDGTTAIGGLDNQPNWGVRTNLSIRCIKDAE